MEQNKVETLQGLGVDLAVTLDRFLGKEDFYLRMLGKFMQDPSFSQLEQALQTKDFEEAFKAAHTLKGVAANMGLEKLNEPAVLLTEELRNAPYDEEKITSLFSQTKDCYQFALAEIGKIV